MMFSLNQIKQCIENCKIAGDVERDSKEFMLAAVMTAANINSLLSLSTSPAILQFSIHCLI